MKRLGNSSRQNATFAPQAGLRHSCVYDSFQIKGPRPHQERRLNLPPKGAGAAPVNCCEFPPALTGPLGMKLVS